MQKSLDSAKVIIKSLIDSIQKLSEEQMNSLTEVNRLEKNAVKIEEIITLVGEIADQTNLLALNASIEAARAGEHGRGFAVVADEIRKLADQSAAAVNAINADMKSIRVSINEAVEASRNSSVSFTSIQGEVEQVNNAFLEIKAAVDEQAAGSSQMLEALTRMRNISGDVLASSSDVTEKNNFILNEIETFRKSTEEIVCEAAVG